jgi:PAS domain S-box-containing protein
MPIAHLDTQLRFRFANKAVEMMSGVPSTELVGRFAGDVPGYHDYLAGEQRLIVETLSGAPTFSEREVKLSNGEHRLMAIQRMPELDHEQTVQGYFVVARDVTEERRAQAERLEQERKLRDALLMEVHHRVKNSLQGIVGLLRLQAAKNPVLMDALAPAIAQVLSVSVGFGLTSVRGQRGIILCEMVREICQNLEQIMGADISVELDRSILQRPVVLERGDAVNLAMIVNELIFNAVKHSPASSLKPLVPVSIARLPASTTIVVRNRIGPEPIAFDFQAGSGLGTGLSLVRTLVPICGAALAFTTEGERLTACLQLPAETSDSPPVS